MEAAVLAAAARARAAGEATQPQACAPEDPSWLRADLDRETEWLLKISGALTTIWQRLDRTPPSSAPQRRATRSGSR